MTPYVISLVQTWTFDQIANDNSATNSILFYANDPVKLSAYNCDFMLLSLVYDWKFANASNIEYKNANDNSANSTF